MKNCFKAGKSKKICAILNIPERTYTRLIDKFGIITERKKAKMHLASITPENLQKLVDSKLSVSEICEKFKIKHTNYKALIEKYNISTPQRESSARIANINAKHFLTLSKSGKAVKEICKELNISNSTYQRLKKKFTEQNPLDILA